MKPPVQLYVVGEPEHDAATLTAVPAAPDDGDTTTEHAGAVAPLLPPPAGTHVSVLPVTVRLEQALRLIDCALAVFAPYSAGPATAARATIRRVGVRIGVS